MSLYNGEDVFGKVQNQDGKENRFYDLLFRVFVTNAKKIKQGRAKGLQFVDGDCVMCKRGGAEKVTLPPIYFVTLTNPHRTPICEAE